MTLHWCLSVATLPAMSFVDSPEMVQRLADLRREHRELDAAIERLAANPGSNQLQLTRMKKRKLRLKDTITRVESRLIPDLDA